jgi:muramoyltetrapeptide carboxypeptidase
VPILRPRLLVPGTKIGIIAPSSAVPRDEFLAGLAWLRGRYEIASYPNILRRDGYLAGSDLARTAEFARMLADPSIAAIIAARGGFGATRIESRLPWEQLQRLPKWIIGFSDITALHVRVAGISLRSIHGPNVTGLASCVSANRLALIDALERGVSADFHGLSTVRAADPTASVAGTSFGGNLAVLCAMAAAGRLMPPTDAVWFIEDVTERPYRVDRMLTSLAPYFGSAKAVVFGQFEQCEPGPDGVTTEQVISRFAEQHSMLTLAGAPFGHGVANQSFVLGAPVEVDRATVRWLDG